MRFSPLTQISRKKGKKERKKGKSARYGNANGKGGKSAAFDHIGTEERALDSLHVCGDWGGGKKKRKKNYQHLCDYLMAEGGVYATCEDIEERKKRDAGFCSAW